MIYPDLMKRIDVTEFHNLDKETQLNHVLKLQKLREQSLAESKIKKTRKASTKQKATKKTTSVNKTNKLLKLIANMSPAELEEFKKNIN